VNYHRSQKKLFVNGIKNMNDKDHILNSIIDALKRKDKLQASDSALLKPIDQVLPSVPSEPEALIEMFRKNSDSLKAEFYIAKSKADAKDYLIHLKNQESWKKIASHKGSIVRQIIEPLDLPLYWTDDGYDVHELAKCDAGITECDALVAQTGSIMLTSRTAGGRALSVLPPHHIVIATRSQLVPDLPTALQIVRQRFSNNYPSMISFITGPSRTGDIERILVYGAHGPVKLTIIMIWNDQG